jgi:hypothetical protein
LLRSIVKDDCTKALRRGVASKKGWGIDIAVTRHNNVDARTFQSRFSDWISASDDKRCREASVHLCENFLLLVEVKLIQQANDELAADMLKLAAAASAVSSVAKDGISLSTALVIVAPNGSDLPDRAPRLLHRLKMRACGALTDSQDVVFPHLFIVAPQFVVVDEIDIASQVPPHRGNMQTYASSAK